MAKTEMFFSPLTQAWAYIFFRPFEGDAAPKVEGLVRSLAAVSQTPVLANVNKEYWTFYTVLDPASLAKLGDPPAKALLLQLQDLCKQSSPVDFIFQMIPTFTPAPHAQYTGLIDFMVNNRWVFDFVTYSERLDPTGGSKNAILAASGLPYPLAVPDLDWFWMIGAAIAFVVSIATVAMAGKGGAAAKPAPAQPAAVSQST
jgi:hypothetical protein